jgi:hypothetical protein
MSDTREGRADLGAGRGGAGCQAAGGEQDRCTCGFLLCGAQQIIGRLGRGPEHRELSVGKQLYFSL